MGKQRVVIYPWFHGLRETFTLYPLWNGSTKGYGLRGSQLYWSTGWASHGWLLVCVGYGAWNQFWQCPPIPLKWDRGTLSKFPLTKNRNGTWSWEYINKWRIPLTTKCVAMQHDVQLNPKTPRIDFNQFLDWEGYPFVTCCGTIAANFC
jgi:hypothetical protein